MSPKCLLRVRRKIDYQRGGTLVRSACLSHDIGPGTQRRFVAVQQMSAIGGNSDFPDYAIVAA